MARKFRGELSAPPSNLNTFGSEVTSAFSEGAETCSALSSQLFGTPSCLIFTWVFRVKSRGSIRSEGGGFVFASLVVFPVALPMCSLPTVDEMSELLLEPRGLLIAGSHPLVPPAAIFCHHSSPCRVSPHSLFQLNHREKVPITCLRCFVLRKQNNSLLLTTYAPSANQKSLKALFLP